MKLFKKILFGTFWPTLVLAVIVYAAFSSHFNDTKSKVVYFFLIILWWEILILITSIIVKWKQYRKDNPAMTKEQKQRLKQRDQEIRYRRSAEFKKKYISYVEIENPYFGNGVLIKDSSPGNNCFTGRKSGFERLYDSFGSRFETLEKDKDNSCEICDFLVREDNIEYVLASLEKIYKRSNQIMEECYDEIYKKLVDFLDDTCGDCLKDDFNLSYLKENRYVSGLYIYDDHAEFLIGIDAAKDPDVDSDYEIIISVDYETLEPSVSFNVVW